MFGTVSHRRQRRSDHESQQQYVRSSDQCEGSAHYAIRSEIFLLRVVAELAAVLMIPLAQDVHRAGASGQVHAGTAKRRAGLLKAATRSAGSPATFAEARAAPSECRATFGEVRATSAGLLAAAAERFAASGQTPAVPC